MLFEFLRCAQYDYLVAYWESLIGEVTRAVLEYAEPASCTVLPWSELTHARPQGEMPLRPVRIDSLQAFENQRHDLLPPIRRPGYGGSLHCQLVPID